MGLENLMELQILIEGIDHFTEPFRQMENTITGAEAKFKSINSTMKMMGKSKSEIDSINSSLQKMADQKAFAGIAGDLEKIGMAKGDIQAMEQSYMKMAQYQRDMAKAQENYSKGKELAMSGVGDLAVGGAGAFGIFELVKQAGEFQSNMAVIQDSTGATTKQMQSFGDSVMNASAQVSRFNDMQMGQIAQTLTSGGFGNVKDVQSLLLPTAKYAEVQMYEHKSSDPIEATKQAIEMAHVFGNYSPKQFEGFLNDFNKYSMMQPGDSSQLAQTLTYLAPTANTMHMKQSDTMALAAIDNVLGLTGSHGGTNSADMILRLIPGLVGGGPKPIYSGKGKNRKITGYKVPKAWQAMEDLGFIDKKGNSKFFNKDGSIKDLSGMLGTMIADSKGKSPKDLMKDYSAIFGVQGGRAAAILSNPRSLEQLGKMRTQLGKTKSMDQINKDLQATPEGQLNLLKSNSMTLMLRLGQQLAISLNPAIAQVNKLLSSMLKFSQAHPQVAKLIGDFALFAVGGKMAQGVIKIFAGNLKMATTAFQMFKLKNAAGELTGFAKVATGTWNILKKGTGVFNDLVSSGVMKLGSGLKALGSAGTAAFKWLGGATVSGIKALGTGLKTFGSGALSVIKTLGKFGAALLKVAVQAAKWAIEMATDWLIAMGPVGWIIMGVTALIAAGIIMWKTNFLGFRDHLKSLWNTISKDAKAVWNAITSWLSNLWNGIKDTASSIWKGLVDALSKAWDAIKSAAESFWNREKQGWENIWNGIVSVAKTVWKGLTSFFSSLWNDIKSVAESFWNREKQGWENIWNGCVDSAKKIFNGLGSFFSGLWSQAEKWGSDLIGHIASGITGAIGAVTKAVSGVVGSVTSFFTGGGGSSASVAKHASGGIFNTPHLGLVAEAGPEAIIPLSNPSRGLALWQQAGMMLGGFTKISPMSSSPSSPGGGYGSGGSPTIIVYASGNITRNERELGDIVSKAILNKVKMQGKI